MPNVQVRVDGFNAHPDFLDEILRVRAEPTTQSRRQPWGIATIEGFQSGVPAGPAAVLVSPGLGFRHATASIQMKGR
jgi:hypothetical protein